MCRAEDLSHLDMSAKHWCEIKDNDTSCHYTVCLHSDENHGVLDWWCVDAASHFKILPLITSPGGNASKYRVGPADIRVQTAISASICNPYHVRYYLEVLLIPRWTKEMMWAGPLGQLGYEGGNTGRQNERGAQIKPNRARINQTVRNQTKHTQPAHPEYENKKRDICYI